MSGRTLILLRHAKSDWSGEVADIDRPLAGRGRRQAPRAGLWLAHNIDRVDLAVVSPSNRTRSTWDLAAAEFDNPPPVRPDDGVYAASASELLGVVRALPDDAATVVLVGHNPGLEDFIAFLTGKRISLPTSAIAVIGLNGSWSTTGPLTGTLRTSGRPPAKLPR